MSLKKSVLLALLTLIITVPSLWYTVFLPYSSTELFFQQAPQYVETLVSNTYPNDLEITVTNGIVSINKPTPYCLLLDNRTKAGVLFDSNFNLDLIKPALLSAYPLCTPVVVIGENSIITIGNNASTYSVQPISPLTNLSITKQLIDEVTQNSAPVLIRWGWILYLVAPVIIIPVALAALLILNLWYAVINKIVFTLIDERTHTPLKASFALSLRFLTVMVIFYSLLTLYNARYEQSLVMAFPFLNTILITVMSVLWVKLIQNNHVQDTTNKPEYQSVDSQVITTPTQKNTTYTLADKSTNKVDSTYSFDPTVISQPTDNKK